MRGVLLVSERLYRALLHLYPKQFRAAYGQQLRLTFRDACRVAYHRNGAGRLLALWLPTLLDLFKSALEERAQQGAIAMSKARLIGLAGPLTILAGSLWLVACLGDLVLRIGLGGDEKFWDLLVVFWSVPFFLSFVPILFAVRCSRWAWRLRTAGGRRAGRPEPLPRPRSIVIRPVRALCPGRCRGTAACPGRRPRDR
jgi:hypothetical protein